VIDFEALAALAAEYCGSIGARSEHAWDNASELTWPRHHTVPVIHVMITNPVLPRQLQRELEKFRSCVFKTKGTSEQVCLWPRVRIEIRG
jgi:hypothetical protein